MVWKQREHRGQRWRSVHLMHSGVLRGAAAAVFAQAGPPPPPAEAKLPLVWKLSLVRCSHRR